MVGWLNHKRRCGVDAGDWTNDPRVVARTQLVSINATTEVD